MPFQLPSLMIDARVAEGNEFYAGSLCQPKMENEIEKRDAGDGARRGSLLVIFLTVFIDLLGFGIVLPLLPIYADQFAVDPSGVQLGLLMASFSIMQFLFAPVWGNLSDRVGRRPVLMIGLAASVVFYALFGLATIWKSLTWLFVARIGAGIAGATIPTTQAYIADCTPPEKRARGMALIGLAFGMGFTFGPLLGFLAVPVEGAAPGPWPGFVASILSAIALGMAIFWLPESRRPGTQHDEVRRKIIDWKGMRVAFRTPAIALLLTAIFVCVFSFSGFETTLSMLIKGVEDVPETPFKFSWKGVCLTYAAIGFTLALVQGGIVRPISTRVSEVAMASAGAILEVVGFSIIALAIQQSSVNLLFVGLFVIVAGFSCIQPSLNSLLSRRSDPEKQGMIMGLGQSVNALARILGSGLSIPLLKLHINAPYVLAAVLMGIGGSLVVLAVRGNPDKPTGESV